MQTAKRDNRGKFEKSHGLYGTRIYHIWNGMMGRCLNPNNKDYKDYGGRGITVCEEWKTPGAFFDWALQNGFREDLTIDRIDVDKGYEPSNCRFVSNSTQQRNRRNNRVVEYAGQSHCIAEWAEITGINRRTIRSRLEMGWTPARALTETPTHKRKWSRRPQNG